MNLEAFWRELTVGPARRVWWVAMGVMFILGRAC